MDLQELSEVVKSFDQTGLGRAIAILATLAELGLAQQSTAGPTEVAEEPKEDPLWSSTTAANFLDITTATLRKYRTRYEMESHGSGKSRRYRKSEIDRVIALRGGNLEDGKPI